MVRRSARLVIQLLFLLPVQAALAASPPAMPASPTPSQTSPTVLVMIAEQQIGQEFLHYWWSFFSGGSDIKAQQTSLGIAESVVNDKLRTAGFTPVDIAARSGSVTLDNAYGIVDLSNQSVRTIGQAYGAEIVVIGKALTRQTRELAGSSMHSVHANLSARAVRVSTGAVAASATTSAPGLHIDETTAGTLALKAGAEQLAAQLIEQMQAGPAR